MMCNKVDQCHSNGTKNTQQRQSKDTDVARQPVVALQFLWSPMPADLSQDNVERVLIVPEDISVQLAAIHVRACLLGLFPLLELHICKAPRKVHGLHCIPGHFQNEVSEAKSVS